jgi:hypothetical protein
LFVIPQRSAGICFYFIILPNQEIVISTEAAHAFGSGAVEKSASLPRLPPSQRRAFALAFCLSFRSAAEESAFASPFSPARQIVVSTEAATVLSWGRAS